jgi:hypothetical protein
LRWNPAQLSMSGRADTYIIKLIGDIRYTMGCALGDFLDRLFAHTDYNDIVVD